MVLFGNTNLFSVHDSVLKNVTNTDQCPAVSQPTIVILMALTSSVLWTTAMSPPFLRIIQEVR